MKVVNVAEKPSVARALAEILSGGHFRTEDGENKYCKNFYFSCTTNGARSEMVFTSVLGHLYALEFQVKRKWEEESPRSLFDAPVVLSIPSESESVSKNLLKVGSGCRRLVVWTDCDREGENIGHQISTLLEGKVGETKRARFSGLSAYEVRRAAENLCEINKNESQAVSLRIELDLRIGAALTRIQTLKLQEIFEEKRIISYGSCQIPTLGFIVEREEAIEAFVPESKWTLEIKADARPIPSAKRSQAEDAKTNGERRSGEEKRKDLGVVFEIEDSESCDKNEEKKRVSSSSKGSDSKNSHTTIYKEKQKGSSHEKKMLTLEDILSQPLNEDIDANEDRKVVFAWSRGYIFEQEYVRLKYEQISGHPVEVTKYAKKSVQKFRPYPLRTVELQKFFARKGGEVATSHELMRIAESLYTKGYISYPRTETDAFPDAFSYREPLENLKRDPVVGAYAASLAPQRPPKGKHNDQAHSPIYPMRDGASLVGKGRAVFEYIARRFLACLSKNAEGMEETVEVTVNREVFTHKTVKVVEKNYLEVYVYEKWGDSGGLLNLKEGDVLNGAAAQKEGHTEQPSLMTEAELIGKMDSNGIGTDATIHDHIQKIKDRNYIVCVDKNHLKSTWVGKGIITGYKKIGLQISEPDLRKAFEISLKNVCSGAEAPEHILKRELVLYKEIYDTLEGSFASFKQEILKEKSSSARSGGGGGGDGGGYTGGYSGGGYTGSAGSAGIFDKRDKAQAQRRPLKENTRTPEKRRQEKARAKVESSDKPATKSTRARASPIAEKSGVPPDQIKKALRAPLSGDKISSGAQDVAWRSGLQLAAKALAMPGPGQEQAGYFEENSFLAELPPDAVVCECNIEAKERKVLKEGKNKGKLFYSCAMHQCDYFVWKGDEGARGRVRQTNPAPPPKKQPKIELDDDVTCLCGMASKLLVSKTEKNKNREFYVCNKTYKRCNFFMWKDEAGAVEPPGKF